MDQSEQVNEPTTPQDERKRRGIAVLSSPRGPDQRECHIPLVTVVYTQYVYSYKTGLRLQLRDA